MRIKFFKEECLAVPPSFQQTTQERLTMRLRIKGCHARSLARCHSLATLAVQDTRGYLIAPIHQFSLYQP